MTACILRYQASGTHAGITVARNRHPIDAVYFDLRRAHVILFYRTADRPHRMTGAALSIYGDPVKPLSISNHRTDRAAFTTPLFLPR